MRGSFPSLPDTELGLTPLQPDATMAEARVPWSKEVTQRFEDGLKAALPWWVGADPKSTTVTVKDERRPSFLLEGGCLVQVEVAYPNKTLLFWCLFFDGETDAVVEPFLDPRTSIPDVIQSIEKERNEKYVRIDPTTIGDYVAEFINYEEFMSEGAEKAGLLVNDAEKAGLLVNDPDPHSSTFGVLDWPTPLLPSEQLEVKECVSKYGMQAVEDTNYSLRVKACMVEGDALVWREFRIFTKDPLEGAYDYKKGQVLRGEREPQVLVVGLPDNCRPQPGTSLGFPEERFGPDPEGWEDVPREEASSILSDVHRRITPVLDRTQLGRWRRQYLAFYDLHLLKIEPATDSDETRIAYILWKPGFAFPLGSRSSPFRQLHEILGAERQKQSGDGRVIRTAEDAAAYVDFFGRHGGGDDAPFIVLKNKDDNAIGQLDWTGAEFADPPFHSIGEVLAAFKAPEAKGVEPSGVQPPFTVDAWILYKSIIFDATFRVLADGSIEPTRTNAIAKARVKGSPPLPCRPLNFFMGPAEFKELAASGLESALNTEYGPSTILENRVLTGQLTREPLPVRIFRRCRFRGRVNLHLLVSDRGLSFDQCTFENGLDLSGASLKGKLSITKCLLVQGRHHPLADTAQPFSLNDLSADGLDIDGLWSTGSLTASGMRIHGAVYLSNMMTLGDMNLNESFIEQSVEFKNVRGASIRLGEAVIKHNSVAFQGVTLTGDLWADFLRVGIGFFLESRHESAFAPNTIKGSINLGGASVPKLLRIRNPDVGKSIKAKAIAAGEVRILGGLRSTRPGANIGGFVDLTDAEIQHDVTLGDLTVGNGSGGGTGSDLTHAEVQHDVTLGDLTVGNGPGEGTGSNASLRLRNAKVGGNVRLFLPAEDAVAQEWLDPKAAEKDFVGEWQHGLDLRNATICGDVELSGVQCPKGGIRLEDAEIQRDLLIRSGSGERATANYLAMTGLKCLGAADITGLDLGDGSVIANLATFAKKLTVAKSLTEGATIRGRLDLSGSTIGELAVSVSSFKEKVTVENLKLHGILLSQALINKFSAIGSKGGYPRPIDLSFSEIKWCIHKVMRDWLRTQGNDTSFGRWKNRGRFLWDIVTRATTSPWRLLLAVGISTLFSVLCVFSNPANIGPSEAGLTAHRGEWQADRVPPDTEWGWRSGVWMALRFHVPVALLTARSAWAPTNGRKLTVSFLHWPICNRSICNWGFSPEDYANFVLALHCLIWPVILIIASRKFFMRLGK